MTAVQTLSRRSLDELETELISLSTRINAAEYEFLVLVREFDLRQGWKAYHFNNCAEWLDMKCGIAANTAREKVRVARALFDLPVASGAFKEGKLSYSKVRSLSRVATPQSEEKLVDYALAATARQGVTPLHRPAQCQPGIINSGCPTNSRPAVFKRFLPRRWQHDDHGGTAP